MKLAKSLSEGVIKIPLSYKIIKNCNISCVEEDTSLIDTKLDYFQQEVTMPTNALPQEDDGCEININDIQNEIRKEIYAEIEEIKENIINQAIEEAQELQGKSEEKGYQIGFKLGYEQAVKEAQEEALTIKNNALSMIEQANRYVANYYTDNRVKIIQLAADMAESIVHNTINTSSENIVMLIKPILQQYGKKENIIITCHPDNIDYIRANLHPMESICPDSKFVLIEDFNLEKNGCIIENEHQIIDLQVKKQIEDILEEIKNLE
ncbi:hypothetical protein GC105_03180 [Alkalibaculum sp. M08DMB]|uniref:Flagellar assembly protein FliH/Type III secretion system HrpE domain-containing protein n=1 Tax=Alkalibaculum sporogenes TaxID=2655001 RepID=A0A6A7K6Q1_9FIRM|nr:FliH/SctL family protein [Alkalibaculum sporogenes]MPW24793.1 hypothetical protein [Alkalibaculum sporogenes]